MIISRKKFEQEIEKAKHEVWDERNRQDEMDRVWRSIYRLEEKVAKLEGHDHDNESNDRRVINELKRS